MKIKTKPSIALMAIAATVAASGCSGPRNAPSAHAETAPTPRAPLPGMPPVLDPLDKYVQLYVPVADVDRLRVGRRVAIELDSQPGRRIAGEISFVADQATFTPEKIETRSDRLGQVYRAKVRILDDVARVQPGTEGNVYLLAEGDHDRSGPPPARAGEHP